ncbi:MAG: phage antirepressor KilAC domain-containing protein [Prevotellaceae bacterium]|jgi:prophage antirepressor-like protein|nr:phage antirepressor KilAC domain-containing protein [Prevotellaceae bacterium]
MEANIQIFKNSQFGEVRVTEIDGKTYFVGSDIAKALGYSNPTGAVATHCKASNIVKRYIAHENGLGGVNVNFIPEGDLYRLAAKSQLPGAEVFESWIFDEILPAIHKHGGYLTAQKLEEALLNPDTLIQLATNLKEERQKRLIAEKQVAVLKPKAEFMDKVMDCDEKIDIGQAAKILQLPFGRNTLFVRLREKGIFFKGRNEPKQEYVERGYFDVKEKWIERDSHDGFMVLKVLVTQKGLSFLARLFEVEQSKKQMAMIA